MVVPALPLKAWMAAAGSPQDWREAGPGKAVEEGELRGARYEEG